MRGEKEEVNQREKRDNREKEENETRRRVKDIEKGQRGRRVWLLESKRKRRELCRETQEGLNGRGEYEMERERS